MGTPHPQEALSVHIPARGSPFPRSSDLLRLCSGIVGRGEDEADIFNDDLKNVKIETLHNIIHIF